MVGLLERKIIKEEILDERQIVEVIDIEEKKRRYSICRKKKKEGREGRKSERILERKRAEIDRIEG